jgi:hypothetical protein
MGGGEGGGESLVARAPPTWYSPRRKLAQRAKEAKMADKVIGDKFYAERVGDDWVIYTRESHTIMGKAYERNVAEIFVAALDEQFTKWYPIASKEA